MSNDKAVQESDKTPNELGNITNDLGLADLLKMQALVAQQIENKRPSVIYEKYLDLVEFLRESKLDLKEFCEIGGAQYTNENKRKKPPITLPFTTGNERKLGVKYTDGKNHWAGRGKTPKWLREQLEKGHSMDEFLAK